MESILKKEVIVNRVILKSLAVVFFVTAISLGAFVRIPLAFTPVPLTLQTFFVLLSAGLLGLRLGLLVQLTYIFLGVTGVSVFTGISTGLIYFLGPTAGYLFGFIAATIFIARFIKYSRGNIYSTMGVFFLANLLLLLCGVIWLKMSLHLDWIKSFAIGFIPFLPGDTLKVTLAAFLLLKIKPRIKSIL
ncbi:MAG: biotin transporter BioY [Candidatus Omnitrophica bacterium]|nr:biotin transporter BioY [Candidatus Omnitrophota bacterium]